MCSTASETGALVQAFRQTFVSGKQIIYKKRLSMTIHEFTRLPFSEKAELLKNAATLIDQYIENGRLVHNYQLHQFFVEAVICLDTESIIDIIPFKRGFLIDRSYLMKQLPHAYHFFTYARVA